RQAAARAGDTSARKRRPYRLLSLAGAVGLPYELALAAAVCPLAGGQAMNGHPCRSPTRGQPPLQRACMLLATHFPRCLRCENTAITRRTILHDSISSHAV
ncbi:hypothetical protein BHE74_00052157, partial [Ensete ventricosum]